MRKVRFIELAKSLMNEKGCWAMEKDRVGGSLPITLREWLRKMSRPEKVPMNDFSTLFEDCGLLTLTYIQSYILLSHSVITSN